MNCPRKAIQQGITRSISALSILAISICYCRASEPDSLLLLFKPSHELPKKLEVGWVVQSEESKSVGFGLVSAETKTIYMAKGVQIRAQDLPDRGNISAGRFPSIRLSKAKDFKIVEVDLPLRYVKVTQDDYFVGFVDGSIFFRWKNVVLKHSKNEIPSEALKTKSVLCEAKDFEHLVEIDLPEHMAAKRNLWSNKITIKE